MPTPSRINAKATTYVLAMFLAGLGVVGYAAVDLAHSHIGYQWLILAALTLGCGSFTVRIPGMPAVILVSDTFVFMLVLLYGPAAATVTIAADGLLMALHRKKPRELQRLLFNFAEPAVSIWCAAKIYYLMPGIAPLVTQSATLTTFIGPMLLCSLVYFVLNSGFTATAVMLETGKPLQLIWRDHFFWLSLNYVGSALIAVLLSVASRGFDVVTLSVVVPLLAISYLTFKTWMGRVEQERQHLAALSELHSSREEERRAATEALRQSEEQYRRLFEESRDAIYVTAPDGPLLDVNDALLRLVGADRADLVGGAAEVAGTSAIESWMPKNDRTRFHGALERDGFARDLPVTLRKKDGATIDCLITTTPWRTPAGTVEAYQGIIRDISNQKLLEEQLRQALKMEAIGRLAGGVAHDFNNLLTVIIGYAETLQAVVTDPLIVDSIGEVRQAAERAALLTHQLLAFSRRQRLEAKLIDLNWVVVNADRMLRRIVGEDITIQPVIASGPLTVLADPGQLEQVLMNVVVNARDAMPNGGIVTIETCLSDVAPSASAVLAPGTYALLSVTDTGTGMTPETQSRIFEPFFTTKGKQGTGLGLATVYGIVRQSGGDIRVRSEVGRGTTFTVFLPLASGVPEHAAVAPRATLTGAEHVLVVEDEPAVRKLVVETLRHHGYRVTEAANGEDALGLFGPADIMLTDVVMPGMDGGSLGARVRSVRPDMRIVFMSGYADHAILKDKVDALKGPFVQKPFTPSGLLTKLREALDAPAPTPNQ